MRKKPAKGTWNDLDTQETGASRLQDDQRVTVESFVREVTKETVEKVGMGGSVGHLSTGGMRVEPGRGLAAYEGGIRKTTIEEDGDLFVGSNIDEPDGLSLAVFVVAQVWNAESMGEGDVLIGNNEDGFSNIFYDASEGRLQFRGGQIVQVYVDTDGSIKAGGGVVLIDLDGVSIVASDVASGIRAYKFVDDNSDVLGGMYGFTPTGEFNVELNTIHEDPLLQPDYGAIILDAYGTVSGEIHLGARNGIFPDAEITITASPSKITIEAAEVVINESGEDQDTRVEGATDTKLLMIDAGLDALGIGGDAESGYKAKVIGDIKITGKLVGPISPASNANDIFRCDIVGGATSLWTGTISGAPSGASVTVSAPVTGNENVLVPTSTSQLAKMRIYNLTQGNHALISDYNTGTNVLILTANAPANWVNGDSLSITSQTVISGGGINWVDLEITSGPTDKTAINMMSTIVGSAAEAFRIHPFETYSASKIQPVTAQVAGVPSNGYPYVKITSNVFSVAWMTGTSTVVLRETGYVN